MIDPVVAKMIEDLAELKAANRVNLPQIMARLQALEEAAEQQHTDHEQQARELARLRALVESRAD